MKNKNTSVVIKSKKVKRSVGENIFQIVNIVLCGLLCLAILLPVLNIVFASFSDPVEVMKHQGLFLRPIKPTLVAYQYVDKNPNIVTGYMNTIFIVVVGTSLNIVLTLIGAYVLSRKNAMLVKFFTLMIVFTGWNNSILSCSTLIETYRKGLVFDIPCCYQHLQSYCHEDGNGQCS